MNRVRSGLRFCRPSGGRQPSEKANLGESDILGRLTPTAREERPYPPPLSEAGTTASPSATGIAFARLRPNSLEVEVL